VAAFDAAHGDITRAEQTMSHRGTIAAALGAGDITPEEEARRGADVRRRLGL
jgi:hypothetical protein